MSADANRVVEPSTNPKAGAEHPAAEHEQEEHQLDPARARAERAQGGTDGRQHAEHRHGLDVEAALAHLGEHDGEQQGQDEREHERGVGAVRQARVGRTSSGQQNATSPATDTSATAATSAAAAAVPGSWRLTPAPPPGPRAPRRR